MSLQQLLCILTFGFAAANRLANRDGATAGISAQSDLTEMKAGALLKMAVQLGIDEDALEKAGDADNLKPALIELIASHTAKGYPVEKKLTRSRKETPGESPENLSQKQKDALDRIPEAMRNAENVMKEEWLRSWSWRRPFEGAQVVPELELHQKVQFLSGSLSLYKGECNLILLDTLPLITNVHECHEACVANEHTSDIHCRHAGCLCQAYSVSSVHHSGPTWLFGTSSVQCKLFARKMAMHYTPDRARICFSYEHVFDYGSDVQELQKKPAYDQSLVWSPSHSTITSTLNS